MNELDDFLKAVLDHHPEAMDAFHSGDTGPWRRVWSATEPITLFGPGKAPAVGREQSFATFEKAAAPLSNGSDGRFEVLHAEMSGDLGFVAGLEHSVFSVGDAPVQPQTLRVTMIYRREDGSWLLVHRHGDRLAA